MKQKKRTWKKRLRRAFEMIITLGMADFLKDIDGSYRRSIISRECADFERRSFLNMVHMAAAGDPCSLKDWPREYRQFCNRDIDRNEPVYIVAGQSLSCCDLRDNDYMQLEYGENGEEGDFVLVKPDAALYANIPQFCEDVPVYDYMIKRLIWKTEASKTAEDIYLEWKKREREREENRVIERSDGARSKVKEDMSSEVSEAKQLSERPAKENFEACLSLVLERNRHKLNTLLDAYRETYPDEQTVVISEYFPDGRQRYCVCRPKDVVGKLKKI